MKVRRGARGAQRRGRRRLDRIVRHQTPCRLVSKDPTCSAALWLMPCSLDGKMLNRYEPPNGFAAQIIESLRHRMTENSGSVGCTRATLIVYPVLNEPSKLRLQLRFCVRVQFDANLDDRLTRVAIVVKRFAVTT